jgi:hypothetical protein
VVAATTLQDMHSLACGSVLHVRVVLGAPFAKSLANLVIPQKQRSERIAWLHGRHSRHPLPTVPPRTQILA